MHGLHPSSLFQRKFSGSVVVPGANDAVDLGKRHGVFLFLSHGLVWLVVSGQLPNLAWQSLAQLKPGLVLISYPTRNPLRNCLPFLLPFAVLRGNDLTL